eukprot:3832406-Prymnesium_polylepis.1
MNSKSATPIGTCRPERRVRSQHLPRAAPQAPLWCGVRMVPGAPWSAPDDPPERSRGSRCSQPMTRATTRPLAT